VAILELEQYFGHRSFGYIDGLDIQYQLHIMFAWS